MNKKSPIEMEEHIIKKATTTLIRLKHSLAADVEINDVLPDRISEFRQAINNGELRGLDTQALLGEVINGPDSKA